MTVTMERFTAIAQCPHCGGLAVHPFRLPRHRPPASVQQITHQRDLIAGMTAFIEALYCGDHYDPSDAEVIRQCAGCGTEWPNR